MTRHSPPRLGAALSGVLVLVGVLAAAGCGVTIPSDPEGTLSQVSGATLRVGVSIDPPLTAVTSGEPGGPLIEITHGFAHRLEAEPEWTIQGEETLVAMLENGDIDLAIGGFTGQTPWTDSVGVTREYAVSPGGDSKTFVMLVPAGENLFLIELERYLDEEVGP